MKRPLNDHIIINFTTIEKRSNIPNVIDILVVNGKPEHRIPFSCIGILCYECPFGYDRKCTAGIEKTPKSAKHFNKLIQPLLKTLRSKPC